MRLLFLSFFLAFSKASHDDILEVLDPIYQKYHPFSHERLTVIGCKYSLSGIAFFCESMHSWECVCNTDTGLGSLVYCCYDNTFVNNTKVDKTIIHYCENFKSLTSEEIRSQYMNASEYISTAKELGQKVERHDYENLNITYIPVDYDPVSFDRAYNSWRARFSNIDLSMWIGSAMIGYWIFVCLIGAIHHWLNKKLIFTKMAKKPLVNMFRKYVLLPSTFSNRRHTHPVKFCVIFGGFVPLRWEVIVISAYYIFVFASCCVNYEYVDGNVFTDSIHGQAARYPGDRTGILCTFGFLLTFLFAGRNNFLLWLTGWKQSTFLMFHRWVTRLNYLLVIIHGASLDIQGRASGVFHIREKAGRWRWAVVAAVAISIIMIQSLYRLRSKIYETFFYVHFVLAVIFLIGSWKHCMAFGYEYFCYAMAAIWGFDRFVRFLRLVHFGIQPAQISLISNEALKVTVPRHNLWKPYPGCFGYLYFLIIPSFLQSHPFSINSMNQTSITFTIRIKHGITSNIAKRVKNSFNQSVIVPVLVEGPYGTHVPIDKFETSLFYTGGTGICAVYSYILDIVEREIMQHTKLYWVVRNWGSLDWFHEELMALRDTFVQVIIYITNPQSDPGIKYLESKGHFYDEKENEVSDDETIQGSYVSKELNFIIIRTGRPDISQLVHDDLVQSAGSTAVVSSAHTIMVDNIRHAVAENLESAGGPVEYFEELQGW